MADDTSKTGTVRAAQAAAPASAPPAEGHLVMVGLNFRTAPLAIRERLSFNQESLPVALRHITGHPLVPEALLLSTCNRTELYAVVEEPDDWRALLCQLLLHTGRGDATEQELENAVYCHAGEEAARHLFRVAAGLDSMVLGEVEIVHQLKQATRIAGEEGATGPVLRRLGDKALEASKLARTEVRYDECGLSVASLAVAACKETFPDLSQLTVMVLGAGETAQLTMHYLISKGVRNVLIANRTIERAQRLAEVTGGQALLFQDFARRLGEADILICCTSSPHYILTPHDLRPALASRAGQPMLIVDLAVPRDVDPAVGEMAGLRLLNLDDMQKQPVEDVCRLRQEKLAEAERLVEEEAREFGHWLRTRLAASTILELQQRLEGLRSQMAADLAADLENAHNGDGKLLIEKYTRSLIRAILRQPIHSLKELAVDDDAETQMETVRKLFGL
jgi:glutamyl-tRNA reductase